MLQISCINFSQWFHYVFDFFLYFVLFRFAAFQANSSQPVFGQFFNLINILQCISILEEKTKSILLLRITLFVFSLINIQRDLVATSFKRAGKFLKKIWMI